MSDPTTLTVRVRGDWAPLRFKFNLVENVMADWAASFARITESMGIIGRTQSDVLDSMFEPVLGVSSNLASSLTDTFQPLFEGLSRSARVADVADAFDTNLDWMNDLFASAGASNVSSTPRLQLDSGSEAGVLDVEGVPADPDVDGSIPSLRSSDSLEGRLDPVAVAAATYVLVLLVLIWQLLEHPSLEQALAPVMSANDVAVACAIVVYRWLKREA